MFFSPPLEFSQSSPSGDDSKELLQQGNNLLPKELRKLRQAGVGNPAPGFTAVIFNNNLIPHPQELARDAMTG